MASSHALSQRRTSWLDRLFGFSRMSKPEQARFILTAATFLGTLILLVWLLLFLGRRAVGLDGWWVAHDGLAAPVIAFQQADLQTISQAGSPRDVSYRDLEQTLRHLVHQPGAGPVVVYLSAPGVADDAQAYLLPPLDGSLALVARGGPRQVLLTIETILDLFRENPTRPKLLILDAGQIGSDRNLGLFANSFLHRLATSLEREKPRNVVILSACAPGQVSWTSEADGRSVFSEFVARGLAGEALAASPGSRRLTVQGLYHYVRDHVASWVATHRQARQTPLLLGDTTLNFTLRRLTPGPEAPGPSTEETDELRERLLTHWSRHEELAEGRPYRHRPVLWRRYQESLLKAECLIRAGRLDEARLRLDELEPLETRLAAPGPSWTEEQTPSLALARRVLAAGAGTSDTAAGPRRLDAYEAALERAVARLTGHAARARGDDDAGQDPSQDGDPAATGPNAEIPSPPSPAADAPKADAPDGDEAGRPLSDDAGQGEGEGQMMQDAEDQDEQLLDGLLAPRGENRPRFVEAQLLFWAETFLQRAGAPHFIAEPTVFQARREAFLDAMRLRRLAEQAAASDERVAAWVRPQVDAGDRARRQVQDRLFALNSDRGEGLAAVADHHPVHQAERLYRHALQAGEAATAALDLVERLQAELPDYGEWLARQGARTPGEGLGEAFDRLDDLLEQAALLIQRLDEPPAASPSENASPPEADRAAVQRLQAQYDTTRAAYQELQRSLQRTATTLAQTSQPELWRAIDDLLVVPTIPVELRRRLLQRVGHDRLAMSLKGASAGANHAARLIAKEPSSSEAASPPDPAFWKYALGLARLERGLLRLGGLFGDDLDALDRAIEAARGDDPASAFSAFERLSTVIRQRRAELVARIETQWRPLADATSQDDAAIQRGLEDADRAVRALTLAETLTWSDDHDTRNLHTYQRQALLVWHGERLLDDFAPEPAQAVLNQAGQLMRTPRLRHALERAEAMRRARLTVQVLPSNELSLDDWRPRPLELAVATSGDVPTGEAAVLVGQDPTMPLRLTVARPDDPTDNPLQALALAPVPSAEPGATSPAVRFRAARTESTPEAERFDLLPTAFYRGSFAAGQTLVASLGPIQEPVIVTIQQSYRNLDRRIPDQFNLHPGQGYMHPHENLRYRLVLTNTTGEPLTAWVRHGLEGAPPFQTEPLRLNPGKNDTETLTGLVQSLDVPVGQPRNVKVEVRRDHAQGELLSTRTYTFHQLLPEQFMRAWAQFEPATRRLHVFVIHLKSDPVTGPVDVTATVAGQSQRQTRLWPGDGWNFWFPIHQPMEKVPWRVDVNLVPGAFQGEEPTGLAPPPGQNGAPAS